MTDTPPRDDPQCDHETQQVEGLDPTGIHRDIVEESQRPPGPPIGIGQIQHGRMVGWREMPFPDPVVIRPGETIIATYAVPTGAYQRDMQIARDGSDDDRLDEFRVALTRGERWPLDRLTDPMLDHLYAEHDGLRARGNPETWERQSAAIARVLMIADKLATGPRHVSACDLREALFAAILPVRPKPDCVAPGSPSPDCLADDTAHCGNCLRSDDTPEQP